MDRLTTRRVCRYLGLLVAAVTFATTPGAGQTMPPRASPPQGTVPRDPAIVGQPLRDRPPVPRVGTAALKGRVVDGVTGNPVARARVRVMGPVGQKPPILTDVNGAFEFTALPPGPYTLSAEKSTYLPARYPEVTRSMRSRAQPLLVSNGQVVEDVTLPLFHGSAITGRVVDAHGDPIDMAQVRVLRVPRSGRPTSAGQTQTNDLGEFRVPRLQPGRYLVQVRPQMAQVNYPDTAVTEALLPQPLPTYYPNVLAMSQAQAIVVNRGETISGVEMALAEGTPTLVTGTVLRSDGQTVNGGSVQTRVVGTEALGGYDSGGGTGLRPGGSFRLLLAPGEYSLEAQVMTRQGPGPIGPEDQLFGSTRINVGAGAVEAVTIMVGRGASASGRVVFEGTTPPPPSPGQTRVPLYHPDGPGCRSGQATIAADWTFKIEGLSGTCGAPPQGMFGRWTLKAVTFRGENLMDQLVTFEPGQQYTNMQIVVTDKRTQMDLRVSGDDGQPTREYVALVFPLDKAKWNPQLRHVRTHMPMPAQAQITTLATGSGSAAFTGRLVTVPMAPGANTGGGPAGPAVGPSGGLVGAPERFVGLPPGEYYVIAVDDMELEDSQDPGVLERLTSSAIRVVLTDDAPIEVPLRRFSFADVMR
jgi:hypothetical protein